MSFNKIILFFCLICIGKTFYANTGTKEDCYSLIDSSTKERINKNYTKSLEYLIKVRELSENNNWKDLQMSALSSMGVLYSHIMEYDKAMQCFQASYDIAVSLSDKHGEISALNNIAGQYSLEKKFDKSNYYIKKAYTIALSMNDSLRMGYTAINIAALANEMGEIDTAEKYIDIALHMIQSQKFHEADPHVIHTKIENLLLKGNYDEAEQWTLDYLKENPDLQSDIIPQFFYLLSKIYDKKGKTQKAIHYGHEALNANPILASKIEIYDHLSTLYKKNNNLSQALLYQDSVIIAKDSLNKVNEIDRETNNQIRIDLLNSERELMENKLKQKSDRGLFIFIIIFVVFLAAILIFIFRIQSTKNKQQKIIVENNQRIIALELEQQKNEKLILEQQLKEQETLVLLEQEKLNNEIDNKNKQLIAKTLFQSNRNKLIEEVIVSLSDISNQSENLLLEPIIRKLKGGLKDSVDLNNFLNYFEQIHPSFISVTKEQHPTLSVDDVRLLSYIYLYSDMRHIAHLLNISIDACRKRKERLAAKMNLNTNELYDYLLQIMKHSI